MPDRCFQRRIFLLSPASCSGRRAEILLREQATFHLAQRLRTAGGVPLGEVFSFLSGLYFRGKLAYASRFAVAPAGSPGAVIITAGRGLISPDTAVGTRELHSFASVPIDHREPQYRNPLAHDAALLADQIGADCQVILLGSIATPKYRDILAEAFKDQLYFPIDFIGSGDMSRGGLMLRCVNSNTELDYCLLDGAALRGTRPAKLIPLAKAPKLPGSTSQPPAPSAK